MRSRQRGPQLGNNPGGRIGGFKLEREQGQRPNPHHPRDLAPSDPPRTGQGEASHARIGAPHMSEDAPLHGARAPYPAGKESGSGDQAAANNSGGNNQ